MEKIKKINGATILGTIDQKRIIGGNFIISGGACDQLLSCSIDEDCIGSCHCNSDKKCA